MSLVSGESAARFGGVRESFEKSFAAGRELGASFAASVNGELVVDLWGGHADAARTRPWQRDTLVNVFSTTKAMAGLCLHRLADQGRRDLVAPVARGLLEERQTAEDLRRRLRERRPSFKGAFAQYSPGGNVGEMLSFTANGGVSGGAAIRGYILETGAAMKTSSANGTEVLVGAQSASQKLYAIVHVLEKQGTAPTLDLLIQSDVTGFGTPTTKVTFAQFNNALGSTYATPITGANTDTYYRASWTIGGSASPGYRFVAAVGIL